jgi:NitT/TauT family transport system substrate-binding protein
MRKVILIALAVFCFAATLIAAAPAEPVRLGVLSGVSGLAVVKMMADGPGSGAQISVYKSPDLLVGKLVTGEVDLAALPTNTAAILYNKGVPVRLTSIIGWGVLYAVSDDPKLQNWPDLKGKEVALSAKGTVPDILFQYLAAKHQLQPERDFTIRYLASPVELAQLTAAGQIGLAVLPEPWVTEVLERNSRMRVALDFQQEWQRVEKGGLAYPQTCLAASGKFLASGPQRVGPFLKRIDDSIRWLEQNSGEGGKLAEQFVQVPANAVVKGLKRCNLRYEDAYKVKGEVGQFLGRLNETVPEAVGGRIPDDGFYYRP